MTPPQTQRAQAKRWALAWGIAIAVQIALWVLLPRWLLSDAEPDAGDWTQSVWDHLPRAEDLRKTEPRPREEGQVVFLPLPERSERPDEARFLDQVDRRAERDTIARQDNEDREGDGMAQSPAPSPQPPQPTQPRPQRPSTPPTSPQERRDTPEPGAPAPRALGREASPSESPVPAPTRPADGGAPSEVIDALEAPAIDWSQMRPTVENMGALLDPGGGSGGRGTYLDLEESERTEISAYQSMYWSFFQRMRASLLQHWSPQRVLRQHDPSGHLYGTADRYTVLDVTLNADGRLRHAVVNRTSGLDFLDAEAIRAFQAAGAFPNPPQGLVDEQGLVRFRFGFRITFRRDSIVRQLWRLDP